jgi:hypothetical protein
MKRKTNEEEQALALFRSMPMRALEVKPGWVDLIFQSPIGTMKLRLRKDNPTPPEVRQRYFFQLAAVIATAVVRRLRLRHYDDIKRFSEHGQMLWRMGRLPPAGLRQMTRNKRKSARVFRKHLYRLDDRSKRPIFRDPRQRFMVENWYWLTTVKSLNCERSPGLRKWWPSIALKLMEREDVNVGRWDAREYKRVRNRLGLVPAMTPSVKQFPNTASGE